MFLYDTTELMPYKNYEPNKWFAKISNGLIGYRVQHY